MTRRRRRALPAASLLAAAALAALATAALVTAGPAAAQSPGDAGRGDPAKGREIARQHCTRCHVVGDLNRYGGIGSTPSFQILARRDDWLERFSVFYALRPHPVFVRVPDVPPPTELPSHVATIEMTLQQIEDVIAFVRQMRAELK